EGKDTTTPESATATSAADAPEAAAETAPDETTEKAPDSEVAAEAPGETDASESPVDAPAKAPEAGESPVDAPVQAPEAGESPLLTLPPRRARDGAAPLGGRVPRPPRTDKTLHFRGKTEHSHGELHRRGRQEAARPDRRGHDGLQERPERGRRRLRQGRRGPAYQGCQGRRQACRSRRRPGHGRSQTGE